MKKRYINKIAVIGSGIMGTGIACHFANCGVEVLLLDIVPKSILPSEEKKGLTLESKSVRNRLALQSLKLAGKTKPSPVYAKHVLHNITPGNIEDDLHKIKDVDWIIEVVIERLDIKKEIFKRIEAFRTDGTLISSNTSGIPIQLMTEGRSEDFKAHFAGTHFFNPVRYLPLLEIIPTTYTKPDIVEFYKHYGEHFLGKTTIHCKDTPGFVGNRIGVYTIGKVLELAHKYKLTIEEADFLTGKVIGRPKTGTFKLSDLVGFDTATRVIKNLKSSCGHDQMIQDLHEPPFVEFLLENQFYGNKTKKGFYYKEKDKNGQWERFVLDLETLDYRALKRPRSEFTKTAKQHSDKNIADGIAYILDGDGKESQFLQEHFASTFAYASQKVPEISNHLYSIDKAMKTGYAWKYGPFEYWDLIGIDKGIDLIKSFGYTVPHWVQELAQSQHNTFYKVVNGQPQYYDINTKNHLDIPGQNNNIDINHIRDKQSVWSNKGAHIIDLNDGILLLEFTSKMNILNSHVLQAINKAIDLAEDQYDGLVISNQGDNFSVGADITMIFMFSVEQEYDELNFAIQYFQKTMMRARYSNIPVVVAPHNMALGGGCELALHADKVVAHAELYMGLVEFGVGVIPGGGGSKEMTLRASDTYSKGDVELNRLQDYFMNIGQAKVSSSALEAMDLGYLKPDRDIIVNNINQLISTAKAHALLLSKSGYTAPIKRKNIKVLGKQALGTFYVGIDSMVEGKYISPYDAEVAKKLAHVMAGGELSEPTLVDEKYLLDLERHAFLELCTQKKTLERIQHMMLKGKPLRN